MLTFLRIGQVIARGINQPKWDDLKTPFAEKYKVLPIDIDSYRHMNNGRYLNYMEATRWSFQSRTGFLKVCLQHRWIAPIVRIEIFYFRPLKLLQTFEVTVQLVKTEERFFYLYQTFLLDGKMCAKALVKSTLRHGKENIPPATYLPLCGFSEADVETPPELQSWVDHFSAPTPRPS